MRIDYDWKDIRSLASEVVRQVVESGTEVRKIVAVAYGGLIPAYFIGKELGVENIQTVRVRSYEGEEQKQLRIDRRAYNMAHDPGADVLIIDDIIETGNTIKELKASLFPEALVASLVVYPDTEVPDYFGIKLENPLEGEVEWVSFPWEQQI